MGEQGAEHPAPPSISKCGPPEQLQGRVQLKVPGEPGLEQNCSVTSSAESNNKHTPINIFRRCTIRSRQTLRLKHSALKPQTFTQKACTGNSKNRSPECSNSSAYGLQRHLRELSPVSSLVECLSDGSNNNTSKKSSHSTNNNNRNNNNNTNTD